MVNSCKEKLNDWGYVHTSSIGLKQFYRNYQWHKCTWLAKRIRNTGYLAFLESHVKIFIPRTWKTMITAFRYLLYAALCSWWYVTLHVVVGDLKSLHTESDILEKSSKLNMISRWVNHVYTLPPKLSSIIKNSDQVPFSAFFASSASILIGEDGEYKKNAYENFGTFSQIFMFIQSRKLCIYIPSPISRNPEHNKNGSRHPPFTCCWCS